MNAPTRPKADAEAIIHAFLLTTLGGVPPFSLRYDGGGGWTFWILAQDVNSYISDSGKIEWNGTRYLPPGPKNPHAIPADLLDELVQPGSPVIFARVSRAWHGPTGVVTHVFELGVTCCVTSHGGQEDGNGEMRVQDLLLDLSSSTGRFHCFLALGARASYWMLDEINILTSEQTAGVLACSARRVAEGLTPVQGVLGPRKYRERPRLYPNPAHQAMEVKAPFSRLGGGALREAKRSAIGAPPLPWVWYFGGQRGEAPDQDSAWLAAEARALAAGDALLNDDGTLALPEPIDVA